MLLPFARLLAAPPLAALLLLSGCSGSDTETAPGSGADAAAAEAEAGALPTQDAAPGDSGDSAQEAALQEAAPSIDGDPAADATACAVTPPNILGPYHKAGAPERNVLVGPADPGIRLTVSGRVLDTGCNPIPNAQLDVWHANAAGAYDMEGFAFRGRFKADAAGLWQLETIVPGWYLNGATYRPAHIHVIAEAAGSASLTTQLYFEGDPYNEGDAFIVPELIMPVQGPAEGPRTAVFDFVLGPL
jgi:protocatechuate 3,4-dioxygenase beta subunit